MLCSCKHAQEDCCRPLCVKLWRWILFWPFLYDLMSFRVIIWVLLHLYQLSVQPAAFIKRSAENIWSCRLFWCKSKFWSWNQTFLHVWFLLGFFWGWAKLFQTMSGSSLSHQHFFQQAFWLQIPFPRYPIPVHVYKRHLPFFFVLFWSLYFSPHNFCYS